MNLTFCYSVIHHESLYLLPLFSLFKKSRPPTFQISFYIIDLICILFQDAVNDNYVTVSLLLSRRHIRTDTNAMSENS